MELKEKLIELRGEKGWSQDDLALKLNVTRQAVSKWERGAAVPSMENLVYIGRLYGVPLDELVNGERQCEEAPATAVAVSEKPEAGEKRGRPKPLQLVGAGILAACIFMTAIVSLITLYYIISTEREEPKDGLTITNQDDMEWEDIDWDDLKPYEWTWEVSE